MYLLELASEKVLNTGIQNYPGVFCQAEGLRGNFNENSHGALRLRMNILLPNVSEDVCTEISLSDLEAYTEADLISAPEELGSQYFQNKPICI